MTGPDPIGRRLALARGSVAPAEWAQCLGVSEAELARVETGEQPPSLDVLRRVRGLTGLNLDWLIVGDGPEAAPEPDLPRRRFSDLSLARLAASLLNDTSLAKTEREALADLIVTAVADPELRAAIVSHFRFLRSPAHAPRR
jgi:transcriptional regulator with XRE-family HTH domain